MERKPIGARMRFEIFKRDLFTCQYCGRHPPDVFLHVDHIVSVFEGGTNEEDNLVTSCQDCNLGKSNIPLTRIPQSLRDKAEEIAEAESQLRGYYAVIQAKRNRIEDEVWQILQILNPRYAHDSVKRDWYNGVQRFIEKLGFVFVREAMEKSVARFQYGERRGFLYFCKICWTKIKGE